MTGNIFRSATISGVAALIFCPLANGDATKAGRLEDLISRYGRNGYLNGSVLIAEHGKVIYEAGVGEANMQSHEPNTPHTKFGIASLTKQFTAVLVLQEVADGHIALNDAVSNYLPWYRQDTGKRLTVEQLLRHTSGLPADFDSAEFNATPEARQNYTPQAFAAKFCQPALSSEPGKKWQYSNCGYILLGLILERETGKPYEDLLRQRLLAPLQMNDSGLDRNTITVAHHAVGYKRHLGPTYSGGPYIDREHIFSAGAMYSTVEDLFRWNQALSGGDLLPASIRERVFQPGLNNWAYGWFVTTVPPGKPGAGGSKAEMAGDMPGNFFSTIVRFPQQDDLIIVLRNGYGSPERLEDNIQAVLFGQPPRIPWRNPADMAVHAYRLLASGIQSFWVPVTVALSLVAAWGVFRFVIPQVLLRRGRPLLH